MQASQIPAKFPVAWAAGANASYIRSIPTPSQQSVTPGAASFEDGFPPVCFQQVGSGGIPPAGQDFNGILNAITAWLQWQNAGGAVSYDATFATAIGGYPKGAILAAATFPNFWFNTVDGNTSNPDQNGAGWTSFKFVGNAPGITSKGGLALDGSNNLELALISNLTADNRAQPVGGDVLALGRAADGAMVSVAASALSAYVLSNVATAAPSLSPPKNGRLIKTAGTYVLTIGGGGPNDPPAAVTDVLATGIGGGGGGGGGGASWTGGGGGSGGPVQDWIRGLKPGDTITLVVGSGGAGAPSGTSGTVASSGTSSTLTSNPSNGVPVSLSSTAGGGAAGGNQSSGGGAPGVGSGSSLGYNLIGAPGGDGNITSSQVQGGAGASSLFGGGGRTSTIGAANGAPAINGQAPGSGGGGIWSNNNVNSQVGGRGADGAWYVQW